MKLPVNRLPDVYRHEAMSRFPESLAALASGLDPGDADVAESIRVVGATVMAMVVEAATLQAPSLAERAD